MSERGKLRKLLMRIVTVIMIVLITGLTYMTALLLSMCSLGRVTQILNNSGYYAEQAKCIEERLKDVTAKAGLDTKVYEGIFESEEIMTITKEYTANRIHGFTDELSKEAVKERIKANIIAMMEEAGESKATIDSEALELYLGQAAGIYEQTVVNALTLNYSGFKAQFSRIAFIAMAMMAVGLGLCIWFIYALTKMRRKTISYMIRALEAAVLLTAVPAIAALASGVCEQLTYSPEYMESFAKAYIYGGVMSCLFGAVILSVIIAILGAAIFKIKQRKNK